jgi:MFS family permease
VVVSATRETTAPVTRGLRRLLWGRAISALGDGLWFTIWALFFTHVLDLPQVTVGAGMAVASGFGLAAAVPLGALADRFDARAVLVTITAVRAVAMACHLLIQGPWTFVLVTVAFTAVTNGGVVVRTALVAGLIDDNDARVKVLAQQRVAQHIGYAGGAGLGALVLSTDRAPIYLLAIAGNALSFVLLAVITATVPSPAPAPASSRGPNARAALRDRPYLAVTAMTAVLCLCWAMLSTGLPLWISRSTHLPLSLSGAVVVIGSVGIAALQVPAAGLARTTGRAARTVTGSGVALAAACAMLATTTGGAGPAAMAMVIGAALLHIAGELGYVAASWGLSVALMREEARGAYQGVSEAVTATVQMAGPAVFAFALGTYGAGGWLLMGVVFLSATAPVPALARWAVRTH